MAYEITDTSDRDKAVSLIKIEGSIATFEHEGKWACIVVA